MTTVVLGACLALLVSMLLYVVRALLGPTVFDRILAMNALGTKTVVFIALLGFLNERADFLDVALVYALVNFVTTVAILKLVERSRLN